MAEKTTLVFTGDIGFDKYMDRKWEDENLLSRELLDFVTESDHVIVNVEGAISAQEATTGSVALNLAHTMNAEAEVFLKKIKADVWNICNNHIMDAGPEGLRDTLAEARKEAVATLGAGMNLAEAARPVIFPEGGGIGLIGVGYQRACRKASEDTAGCLSWADMETIQKSIDEVKKSCRWCIIVAHGGEEFTAIPTPYTRDRYLTYLEMGADLVVSHHPHVPMNYELVGEKAIFYSLGNFVFDTDYQRSQFNTEYGIVLKLRFTEENYSFEAMGLKIDRETERIAEHALPDIFTDIQEEEYRKLVPLAAKMFIANTKRQLRYLYPARFKDATEQDFIDNFYEPLRSGRVPGEVLDFQIVYPLSLQAEEGAWKECKLEKVKEFILRQIPS